MKIVVSQEEYIKFSKPFDALERNYYDFLSNHELVPVPNIVKVPDYDYDCLLLTGGPDSPARHKTENLLFAHAFKKKLPIIGICHGAFVINDLCGGNYCGLLFDRFYRARQNLFRSSLLGGFHIGRSEVILLDEA